MSDDTPDVVALPFHIFLEWMADVWKAGQHIALIGPTGEGKTTLAVPLLRLRKWVMALDPKGKDETLQQSGFNRITKLPLPRKVRQDIAEEKPARLILGGSSDSIAADKALRKLMAEALEMVRSQGGWTLYADEFQVLADMKMFNLGAFVERLLVSARSKGTSVVCSFQAPAWVPKAATRQASFVILFPTRDVNMVKAIAETMGREWQGLFAMVKKLPPYHCLVIPKSLHSPIILIHPEPLD